MLFAHLGQLFKAAPAARIFLRVPTLDADRWSTSSFAEPADTSPLELFDLGEHLQRCCRSRGRLFPALCLSDSVERFLAPRFMTTMVAIALISALLAML